MADRLKIIIVDPEAAGQDELRRVLADLGVEVIEAGSRDEMPLDAEPFQELINTRVREQSCLLEVSKLVVSNSAPMPDLLGAAARIIAECWDRPGGVSVRLSVGALACDTAAFQETPWRITAPLVTGDERYGEVAVHQNSAPADPATNPFFPEEQRLLDAIGRMIGQAVERAGAAKRQVLSARLLEMLNRRYEMGELIRGILRLVHEWSGLDAAGIRLRDGDRFPYAETRGFTPEFLEKSTGFCAGIYDEPECVDTPGDPGCLCQRVLTGDIDLTLGCVTDAGSFWTNNATALLTSGAAGPAGPCRRWSICCDAGYETVGLLPLRASGEVIGLLQLNDHRTGMFTLEMIRFLEGLGASIGIALSQQRAAAALRVSKENLERILDSVYFGVMIIDSKTRRVVSANRAALEMIGHGSLDSLIGVPCHNNLCPADCGQCPILDLGETVNNSDRILLTACGDEVPILKCATKIELDGDEVILESFVDITDRRRAEEERAQLLEQMTQLQRLESIGTIASGVAHELNNPLSVVMSYAELIKKSARTSANVARQAGVIVQESLRMAGIVSDLLSFARVEKQPHRSTDVRALVEGTLSLVRPTMRRDRIDLRVEIPDGLPRIPCLAQKIQQVLMNLLTNARDALNTRFPEGSPDKVLRILARSCPRGEVGWVRLTVEDHGDGVSPEVAESLFEPFVTTKARHKGTGLGLSISRGIVQDHKGELTVESAPGGPTRFHVELMADGEQPRNDNPHPSATRSAGSPRL